MKNIRVIQDALRKREKLVLLLAPSFVVEFSYPEIIFNLRKMGIDKIVELTFGAKLVNREYHKILEAKPHRFFISSVCPGIVETIKQKYPKIKSNIIPIDSPMIATAKLCKKIYPKHKTVFISPCNFKKTEAKDSKYVDYVLDYQELGELFRLEKIDLSKKHKGKHHFDKFYNDYTKIYPLAGGLSKTAHLKGVLKKGEEKIIDGIAEVEDFIRNIAKQKNIRFLDVNFCRGGCIGGPCISASTSLKKRRQRLMKYLELSKHERIPDVDKGLLKKAEGITLEIN